jgi:hypothetical protein
MQTQTDPNDAWHRDFSRLAELRDCVPSTGEGTFFHGIPSIIQKSALARDYYRQLESDLHALDEPAWRAFKSKVLKCDVKSHDHRGYTGVHSILCEARGYQYLKTELNRSKLPYEQIHPIAEDRKDKRPDWGAFSRGSVVSLLEVKAVYESDDCLEQILADTKQLRESGEATVRRVDPEISEGFWEKLRSTVSKAKEQLHAYESNKAIPRIALLIVHFDLNLRLSSVNREVVSSFLDGFNEGLFKVAYQYQA